MNVITWDAKRAFQDESQWKKAETAKTRIGWPKEIFDVRIESKVHNTKAACA
jgi:hypothetical protein